MLAKPVRRDEQIKLIMECRQSGLTDFEWCRQHNINVGTFYNWVKRLKRSEGITFPRGKKPDSALAYRQEVVKLRNRNLYGSRKRLLFLSTHPFTMRLH